MNLPSCTFGPTVQTPQLQDFSACEKTGADGEIIYPICDGQIFEDAAGTISLGFTSTGKDSIEQKSLQDQILDGRPCNETFYCNGVLENFVGNLTKPEPEIFKHKAGKAAFFMMITARVIPMITATVLTFF